MSLFYRFLIARLAAFFTRVSWGDFIRIVDMVEEAAKKWPTPPTLTDEQKAAANRERAGFVVTFIRRVVPGIPTGMVNFLNELALAFSRRF